MLYNLGNSHRLTKSEFLQAGGKDVSFGEQLTFHNKQLFEKSLKVQVCDKDTFSDDVLGECELNLDLLGLTKDAVSEVACLASHQQCRLYVYCTDNIAWWCLCKGWLLKIAHTEAHGIWDYVPRQASGQGFPELLAQYCNGHKLERVQDDRSNGHHAA